MDRRTTSFNLWGFKAFLGRVLSLNACLLASLASVHAQAPELSEEKVLLNNISAPWGFTFIDSDSLLFTEKRGKLFCYVLSSNALTEITGVPAISQNGQGGLLDIALHPDFSSNRLVYLTYAVNATGGQTTALGRGKLNGNRLDSFRELFRALPIRNSGQHFGSRIVFDRNKRIYMSVGDRGLPETAQDNTTHLGKVLRLNDDGTVPADNPLIGEPNSKPEIFCWGNRNIQGMAMHPVSGEIYAHEHGPRGGDELNLLKPGTNYGWPSVTFGINYDGTRITPDTTLPGMQLPLTYWVPSIAPSGMTFVLNGQAANEADILIGALAGTHIHWLRLKDDKKVLATRSMNGYARFRDIRQAPDGKIYAMTESPNRLVLLRSNVPILTSTDDPLSPLATEAVCYPNPLNDKATLAFTLPFGGAVEVHLLDTRGQYLKAVAKGTFSAGRHEIPVETANLSAGVYLLEIRNAQSRVVVKAVKE